MAFWALKHVKGFTEKLHMGDKIKGIMSQSNQKESTDLQNQKFHQPQKLVIIQKQELDEAQLLKLQVIQYAKLCELQNAIMKEYEQKEGKMLQARQKALQEKLNQLSIEQQLQKKEIKKKKLIDQIQSGQKTIQQLMEQNLIIKEEIQAKKIASD